MATKVLLDTDIGSDIDDAVCLAYLLAQPECELLGITTVSGEPEKRAMLASALCIEAGVDVPVFPGTPMPLIGRQLQPSAAQASALTKWEHRTEFPRSQAIDFMRDTIRAYPGEVDLLAIGPMTNVALLFAMDPQIPSLLKGLTLMCGVFYRSVGVRSIEWNALCDPYAAAIVYNARVPLHRTVGLDVTLQVTMSADDVRERFGDGLLRPVRDFAEVWFQRQPEVVFHDPLAGVSLFDDTICRYTPARVEVELQTTALQGMTIAIPVVGESPHEVATVVDKERFFDHFFGVFDRRAR